MTTTSHPEFHAHTEGEEVAKAFAENIRGRTIVVTGVNLGGIGFTTAESFASQSPAHLIIAGRSPKKLQESADTLKALFPGVDYRLLHLDLSSQESVRDAASTLLGWSDIPVVDLLVNSAGIMNIPQHTLTKEGIEITFATNHIGHFLFTSLIMPKLLKAAESSSKGSTRIINVSSLSPTIANMRWSDINFQKKTRDLPETERPNVEMLRSWGLMDGTDVSDQAYIPLEAYNQSKVANVLFGIALTARLYNKFGILSLAVHPGVIETELARFFPQEIRAVIKDYKERGVIPQKGLAAGASTSLVAALDPCLGAGELKDGKENYGAYLSDCQIFDKAVPLAVSSTEAERLWKLSEDMVKQSFSW